MFITNHHDSFHPLGKKYFVKIKNSQNIMANIVGIVHMDKIKETDIKEKVASEYKRSLKLLLISKLNDRNNILALTRGMYQ